MAPKPDEIERQIAQQREKISREISGLRQRVRDDADQARSAAQGRVSWMNQKATSGFGLDDQVQKHPMASMASGFSLGVALGMASDSVPLRRRRNGLSASMSRDSGLGRMFAPIADAIEQQVQTLVSEVTAGFVNEKRQPAGPDGYHRQN